MTSDPKGGTPGDPITIIYTLVNTGQGEIGSVIVEDTRLGVIVEDLTLAPGTRWTRSRATTIQSDVGKYEATATGTDASGQTVTARDEAWVTVVLAEPPREPTIDPCTA